uniref:Uncharacterized protein n=1 Tax=Plectus sambesii TaxID=2011161 RepID=A0A914W1Q0_9BILA
MSRAFVWLTLLVVYCWSKCEAGGEESHLRDSPNQQQWHHPSDTSLDKRSGESREITFGDWGNKPLMFGRLRMPVYYDQQYGKRAYQPRHPALLARHLMRSSTADKRHSPIASEVDNYSPSRFGKRHNDSYEGVKRNQMPSEFDLNLPLRFGKREYKKNKQRMVSKLIICCVIAITLLLHPAVLQVEANGGKNRILVRLGKRDWPSAFDDAIIDIAKAEENQQPFENLYLTEA